MASIQSGYKNFSECLKKKKKKKEMTQNNPVVLHDKWKKPFFLTQDHTC